MAAPVPDEPLALDIAIVSDVGNVREQNEDRGRSVHPGDPATLARKGVLVLVADGMGGHEAGEVASSTAAEVVATSYYAHPGEPREALNDAVTEANARIWNAAQSDDDRHGMGTTCTTLVLRGHEAYSAHVGDSRLYRLRDRAFEKLTTDHSMVEEMVADGLITEEEARHHDARNVITRALGIHETVDVALGGPLSVSVGDVFVLMSDGLYDLVTDAEMGAMLATPSVHDAANALVERAKARGGHDNVTVAVIRVKAANELATDRETMEAPALS
ncbi:MAG: Stp1/IreP family PP2C-type Ser/Thr phosphatase [Bacteroidota bacterium]